MKSDVNRKAGRRLGAAPWLDHFEPHMLLIAATRYFTGRMTIATCAFARELATAWPEIPEETRNIIKRDLEDEFRRDDEARKRGDQHKPLGMDCDREAWKQVRAMWSNDRTERPAGQAGSSQPKESNDR